MAELPRLRLATHAPAVGSATASARRPVPVGAAQYGTCGSSEFYWQPAFAAHAAAAALVRQPLRRRKIGPARTTCRAAGRPAKGASAARDTDLGQVPPETTESAIDLWGHR